MSYNTSGYDTEGDVMGDETEGDYTTVGRARRRRAGQRGLALPPKPAWRNQLAPGVPMPGEGLQPLPLTPSLNNGVFTSGFTSISFTARPQAPFHPERLLASVRRTGTAAAGNIIAAQNLFVGRDLQLVELGQFDVEFFSPTAFGVRLQLDAAQPGVLISIDCKAIGAALTTTDTLAVSLMFLGRSIR
jgi:hypothetical protein